MNIRLESTNTPSAKLALKHGKFSQKYSQSHADKSLASASSRAEMEREKRQANYSSKRESKND